jgi:hypothetical protein
MQCTTCGQSFTGRRNRRYCSGACLRRKGYERRTWDMRAQQLADPAFSSELFGLELIGQERQQANAWRQCLLTELGERP